MAVHHKALGEQQGGQVLLLGLKIILIRGIKAVWLINKSSILCRKYTDIQGIDIGAGDWQAQLMRGGQNTIGRGWLHVTGQQLGAASVRLLPVVAGDGTVENLVVILQSHCPVVMRPIRGLVEEGQREAACQVEGHVRTVCGFKAVQCLPIFAGINRIGDVGDELLQPEDFKLNHLLSVSRILMGGYRLVNQIIHHNCIPCNHRQTFSCQQITQGGEGVGLKISKFHNKIPFPII